MGRKGEETNQSWWVESKEGTGRRGVPCLNVLAEDHWSWVASGHLAQTYTGPSDRDTNTHLVKGHWTEKRGRQAGGGGCERGRWSVAIGRRVAEWRAEVWSGAIHKDRGDETSLWARGCCRESHRARPSTVRLQWEERNIVDVNIRQQIIINSKEYNKVCGRLTCGWTQLHDVNADNLSVKIVKVSFIVYCCCLRNCTLSIKQTISCRAPL